MSKDEFVELARKNFGERYDYSLFDDLPPFGQKLAIRCQAHEQVFLQEARNHLRGHVGCQGCISQKLSGPRGERGELRSPDVLTAKFIERTKQVHGERYDYSRFVYTSSSNKGVIICRQHGEFRQAPSNHLCGSGCPVCARGAAGKGSFKARCKALGIDYWRALKRREAGVSEEKVFRRGYIRSDRETSPVTVNGVEYPNLRAAVRALDSVVSPKTIARRLNQGMTPEEAFQKVPNPGYANGIIYRVVHIANGKSYVGLTVQTLEQRWRNHLEQAQSGGVRSEDSLHQAIRDFGAGAFTIKQIDSGTTKGTLEAKERLWIEKLGTLAPAGFNIAEGGVSGGSNPKPCTVDGKKFRSVGEAAAYVAESRGINLDAAKWRLRNNRLDARKPAAKGQSLVKTAAYKVWSQIVHCVLNPRSKSYKPGLGVCEQWKSFDGFLAAVGQPPAPGMVFTRLDKTRDYVPDNCAWMIKSDASKLNAAWMKTTGKLTGRKTRKQVAE
ncbi:MAG: GIY-YIG nuclease family protein [Thiobacillus sp.]|nr:GIY-YIG nuclease family protein [Thiobacillus sp.]MDP2978820.1 GIY-YIG nuclease family protein [Thiobacillus sp.]